MLKERPDRLDAIRTGSVLPAFIQWAESYRLSGGQSTEDAIFEGGVIALRAQKSGYSFPQAMRAGIDAYFATLGPTEVDLR